MNGSKVIKVRISPIGPSKILIHGNPHRALNFKVETMKMMSDQLETKTNRKRILNRAGNDVFEP